MKPTTFKDLFATGIAIALAAGVARAQNVASGAAIDAVLRAAVERQDVPGVVALVTNRDRVLYQGAFGVADVGSGRPLGTDALFRLASLTKTGTSPPPMTRVQQR